jgi:hypothetical protein
MGIMNAHHYSLGLTYLLYTILELLTTYIWFWCLAYSIKGHKGLDTYLSYIIRKEVIVPKCQYDTKF